jgi:V/A-type H+-transporting ATPase subunit K
MYWLISLMTLGILAVIATGIYLELRPAPVVQGQQRFRQTLIANLVLFGCAELVLLLMGAQEVMAQPELAAEGAAGGVSVGLGLAIIGVGLPTAFSTIAAGIAVGPIGAASLAALAEKPEILGRTLIYLGLAEGIAIYGLVMSILLLDRI